MTIQHDTTADAIYIRLRDVPYAFGEDLDAERRIDYGHDQKPIGIELLNVSHGVNIDDLPQSKAVGKLLEQHNIRVFA